MSKRKFITARRATGIIYWDCPGKCGAWKDIEDKKIPLPVKIQCKCGVDYMVKLIGMSTVGIVRVLIEVTE